MKKRFAIVSLLSTLLFLTACTSTGSHQDRPTAQTASNWQKCAVAGGAVLGIPAAIGSIATGGAAAVVGALAAGIGCAVDNKTASTVRFGFGAHNLDMRDRLMINKVIKRMGSEGKVKVVGYTCDIGTDKDNMDLSDDRAMAVKAYLMKQGIPEHRIMVEGLGEQYPVAKNNSEENRKKNRRVEMTVTY